MRRNERLLRVQKIVREDQHAAGFEQPREVAHSLLVLRVVHDVMHDVHARDCIEAAFLERERRIAHVETRRLDVRKAPADRSQRCIG
jgi:hypothetical protein